MCVCVFPCWRALTTNRGPLSVLVVVLYRAVNQLFYVGPDCFVVRDVFLSVFDGSIVTITMGRSTQSRLDVSTSLGLPKRSKRLDKNV